MADNVSLPASSVKAAARDVTYSGEAAQAQAVGLVAFSGSDDAKSVADIGGDATNGLDVDVTRLPSCSVMNATSGDGSTALTNGAQVIKGSAGTLDGWAIYNPNTAAAYVCIYNVAAASVVVGTTTPALLLTIPSSSAAHVGLARGIAFSTAISWAAASTAGGNGALTTALDANAFYT